MNDLQRCFSLIGRIVEVAAGTATLGVAVTLFTLMYVASPPRQTLRRYPLSIRLRLLLPSWGWRDAVLPEDVEALQRLRKALLLCAALFLGWNTTVVLLFDVLLPRLLPVLCAGGGDEGVQRLPALVISALRRLR